MLRTAGVVLWKDLRIELRTRDAVSAALVFSILVLVIFNFALDVNTPEMRRLAAGFFWVAFAFAGTLSLNRSFALEKESGAGRALSLAPVDPAGIFLGKALANAVFLAVTQFVVLPLFVVFFDVSVVRVWALAVSFALGSIAFAATGTLFSAIASNTRMRELLLPVLFLPVSVPALIAAVETTSFALGNTESASFWFTLLIVYDVVFVTASLLVFEYVVEE
jgi:heme exporter protein B